MGLSTWLLLLPILFLLFLSRPISSEQALTIEEEDLALIPLKFLNRAKSPEIHDYMVSIRRRIHEHPELSFEEFETSKLIRTELDRIGIPYKYPLAVTGVVGYVGTGEPPFVAIRADMDALAMEEEVDWEHKSKVAGKMHACGHDAHVAMLLGAAKLLQQHKHHFQGTVVLVFQPAEERGGGAKLMIEDGALQNVDAIFGLHVSPKFPIGTVGARPGLIMAGCSFFEAVITGKGGHAALPHYTIDPILAASTIVLCLQQLVSREADPLESQVVTVAKFTGGDTFNVIPNSVTIGGTFRTLSKESFYQLKNRIQEVIIKQSKLHRCSGSVTFNTNSFCPPNTNDAHLHRHLKNVVQDMIGEHKLLDLKPTMGSEDFSFYSEVVPSYYFLVGMNNDSQGVLYPSGHSSKYRVNEDVLPYGAALHAALATRYILEHQSVPDSTAEVLSRDEL